MTSTTNRYNRVKELRENHPIHSVYDLANVLRSTTGLHDESIGLGNELAINQLTGHHSIMFNTNEKLIYIAGVPSQSGPYLVYDLDSIFNYQYKSAGRLWTDSIESASIVRTKAYEDFLTYRNRKRKLSYDVHNNSKWTNDELTSFIQLNPDHYEGYALVGDYFESHGKDSIAKAMYQNALNKQIPWEVDKEDLKKKLSKLK